MHAQSSYDFCLAPIMVPRLWSYGINELQQIVISINLMLDYFGSREKMENRGF